MNDLQPPPRRSIEPNRSRIMREHLTNEAYEPERRRSYVRLAAPWLAAAAVAAIAVTGIAVTSGDDSTGNTELQPATGASATPTRKPGESTTIPWKQPAKANQSPAMSDAEAFAQCRRLLSGPGGPGGQWQEAAADSAEGSTLAVMTNGTRVVTCNLAPDQALSTVRSATPEISTATFDVANNFLGNVLRGSKDGDYTWAGGALPDGVDSVTYVFPDGHEQAAVIESGYWMMQYLSPGSFDSARDQITVETNGSAGPRTLALEWGTDTCGQSSHGC